ncbi:MAG TPA: FAD-dependent monooxygenase [Ktedonobacteraceae bacterium]|nr:FAD-dependent monooxygenase [Ktedonobacteraceae bacterium]
MTNTSPLDVLVVGAGPAGLTLAIDLARRDISCRIIDKLALFPTGTRARGIGARTQEIFEDLGMLEALSTYAEPFLPSRFYDRNNHILREVTPASGIDPATLSPPDAPYRPSLMVSQQFTDAVLRERLASFGVEVEQDCQLIGFTQDRDHITAEVIRAGKREVIGVRYLVGCDGGASMVRKCAMISFLGETWDAETLYLLGNLSVSGLDKGYWHTWTDPSWGYVSLQPMIKAATWLFAATVSSDQYSSLPFPTLATFQDLFTERVGVAGVRFDQLTWQSLYRRNLRVVDRYRSGRVLLAGDATHVGQEQGMNISIQDAYNLGWKLAHVLKGAPDALLESYQAERLPIVQQNLITMSARNLASKGGVPAAAQSITDAILNKERAVDPTQLSVTYRESPLSCDLDDAARIRAGDRAPDAPCIQAESGKQVRLFELFRGTHFTLLTFRSDAPQQPDVSNSFLQTYTIARSGSTSINRNTLLDRDGHAYRAYGISDAALVLVRPDGYIGLTSGSLGPEPIIEYLHRVISQ